MNHRLRWLTATAVVVALALSVGAVTAQKPDPAGGGEEPHAALGGGFTFQGRLKSSGSPVNGACDFTFKLYGESGGGLQIGDTETELGVAVADGLFTVTLNEAGSFGDDAFQGWGRWLETAVRCPAGTGSYTTLTPRQELAATPYSLYAAAAASMPSPLFGYQIVENAASVGSCTSVAIGVDGLPLISYFDGTNGNLKVAHCNNLECTNLTASTIDDSANIVGEHTSLAIGQDGLGLISYYDATAQDLKVAHCNNIACTSATTTSIDTTNIVGRDTSIAIGTDGLGIISYEDVTNHDLKVAHCDNVNCSSATKRTLHSTGLVGEYTSIAIGSDGLPLISYYDNSSGDLRLARCTTVTCSIWDLRILDSAAEVVGHYSSIAIGSDGLAIVSYYDLTNTALKTAHCSNLDCTSAAIYTLDNDASVGLYTSITIGADGLPLISYFDTSTDDLKILHCGYSTCSAGIQRHTLDSVNAVGTYSSITIGRDGFGLISYYDSSSTALRVLHCSDIYCQPFVRRH